MCFSKRPGTSWEDMEIKWYRRLPNAAKAEEVKTGEERFEAFHLLVVGLQ